MRVWRLEVDVIDFIEKDRCERIFGPPITPMAADKKRQKGQLKPLLRDRMCS